jgi:predicted ribosomally synthesized peptide with SipW-like signal peptide
MKNFKKVIIMCLAMVLVAALAIAGTIAYLTDTDSKTNVMTVGSVDIEQIEQEYNANGELVDFTQAKPLMPYVGTLGWKNTNNYAYRSFTMNNVVDKYVSVKNNGKSDAYVRTLIAFEMGEMTTAEWAKAISVSINSATRADFAGTWSWSAFDADAMVIEVDGHNYALYVATHQNAVKPGETTIPSLLQVYMDKSCDNAEVTKIDGNENGTYDILVFSQAVQAAGFENAKTALDTAFGKTAERALSGSAV